MFGQITAYCSGTRDWIKEQSTKIADEENSWIDSISERVGEIVGGAFGGAFGAVYALGKSFSECKDKNEAAKKNAKMGEMLGLYLLGTGGVLLGAKVNNYLNNDYQVVSIISSLALTQCLAGTYAGSIGSAVAGTATLIHKFVLDSIIESYNEALNYGSKGVEVGKYVTKVAPRLATKIGANLIGRLGTFTGVTAPKMPANTEFACSVSLAAIGAIAIDVFTGLGLTQAFALSAGMEAGKAAVNYLTPENWGKDVEDKIDKVRSCASYVLGAGVYAKGTLQGGLIGHTVRQVLLSTLGSISWKNALLIKQWASICLSYSYELSLGYAGCMIESPGATFIFTALAIGALSSFITTTQPPTAQKP